MREETKSFLVRTAGLTCVGLIGLMIVGCGLALSFGNYRLSTILFFTVTVTLIVIKIITRMLD